MTTSNTFAADFYTNVVEIDEATGLPADYDSFFAAYRPLILAAAERAKIPEHDREDALQVIQMKFWQKDGLNLYDPNRNTKFATLLRSWAGKFLLQEWDKSKKHRERHTTLTPYEADDQMELFQKPFDTDTPDQTIREIGTEQWLKAAETALREANAAYLIPLLELCVRVSANGSGPSRAEISQALGCNKSRSTRLLNEMRTKLTNAGLGADSLYD